MRVADLKADIKRKVKKAVLPEGDERAKIVFVGEAGGAEEEKLGRPFVGRAGKFLDKELEKFGFDRKRLYITNIVKYRCIGPPRPRDIEKCEPWIREELLSIKPKIVVMLGKTAEEHTPRLSGIKYVALPHPAAAMRFTKQKEKFEKGMKELKKLASKL